MKMITAAGFPQFFVRIICVLFVGFLWLDSAAAQTSAQKEKDVQLLLANDANLVKLKQELGAREIDNVQYLQDWKIEYPSGAHAGSNALLV